MNATPGVNTMPVVEARRIAAAFAPRQPWGNRWDYFYVLSKLRSDPLYPGVVQTLRGSSAPLLDLGCGLGLLAHALRRDGQTLPYRGVDSDAGKLRRGEAAARRAALAEVGFEQMDLSRQSPTHRGSVAILDVLQYLPADAQLDLVRNAAAMLDGNARLVMRMALADTSRRGRLTRIGDHAGHLVGWMGAQPRSYPDIDALRDLLHGAGLATRLSPLHAGTPFNNWLLVAENAH